MAAQRAPRKSLAMQASLFRIATVVTALLPIALAPIARAASDQSSADLVARGKYLADAGDCMACHTKPGGQPFAGGRYLPTPFGPLSTPNITPDKETGIGDWTDDQFYRVLHEGIGKDGEYLYPAMPYPWYTKVTRDDVLAIKAYLFSLNPVHAPREPNKMAFPFNIRTGLLAWNEAFFHEGTFQPDPAKSAEVNRGAYLVQGLGHCGECHNGHSLLGNGSIGTTACRADRSRIGMHPISPPTCMRGSASIPTTSSSPTSRPVRRQGMGAASGPMAETIHDSLSKLTDADLHAIVAYLKSTPAEASYASTQRSDYTGPQPVGRDTYLNYCSSCHQPNGQGIPGAVASLVGNGAVLAGGPQDVIRTILGGIEAKGTDAPMPAIGTGMTDQEIADVTNYVRQAWGNSATNRRVLEWPATCARARSRRCTDRLLAIARKSRRRKSRLPYPIPKPALPKPARNEPGERAADHRADCAESKSRGTACASGRHRQWPDTRLLPDHPPGRQDFRSAEDHPARSVQRTCLFGSKNQRTGMRLRNAIPSAAKAPVVWTLAKAARPSWSSILPAVA